MEYIGSLHSVGPTKAFAPHDLPSPMNSFHHRDAHLTGKPLEVTGTPISDFDESYLSSDISSHIPVSEATPSPPMETWTFDKEGTGLSEKLLDMEFQNDIHTNDLNSLLYAPSFQDTTSYDAPFSVNGVTPFIQDKNHLQEIDTENTLLKSIDPQSISIKNEEPVYETAQPSPPENLSIKADSALDAAGAESQNTMFTAFTPMRLDEDTSFSIKPLSSLQSRGKSPSNVSDLRPSLDEYNKLSSKEKRQLRNKISARNFRNRRKEYISLLEEQLTERDSLIESLQEQISRLRLENTNLQEELRSQKSKTNPSMEVSKILNALQRNAQNTETQDASNNRPCSRGSPRLQPLTVPNTRKDVSATARPGSPSSSFWGGVGNMSSIATAVA